MSTLSTFAIAGSAVSVLVTGGLAWAFASNPVRGMAQATHRPEQLPYVMADRYTAFALLGAGAAVYGDLKVIAFLFVVFTLVSVADVAIYARAGHPFVRHLMAGVAAALVAAVALAALFQTGAS